MRRGFPRIPDLRQRLRACARLSSLTLATILSAPAAAQTMDHGALQQLFGEPVTTSATGTPQRVTEVPANMEIITADEIRRSGAYDVPGVLRHVLGVDVLQWFNDNADVGLRGYNQAFSPRVLVLIDGRQVYADHYGYTPWASLPIEFGAIRQIEVVKGPSTALFGFNAVSGVINIVTYNPAYDDVNTASIGGGTQGLAQGSIVKTLRAGDRTVFRLTAGGRLDNDFSTTIPSSLGVLPRRDNDRFGLDLDGIFQLSETVQLSFEGTHAGAATNDIDPIYSLAQDQQFNSSLKAQVTAGTRFGLLQSTIYRNWTTQKVFNQLGQPMNFKDDVTVVQLQDSFRAGNAHTFRAALEYRHNEANTTPFPGGTISYDIYSAAGMWSWAITPTVSLTNALRLDSLQLERSGALPDGYPFANADWDRNIDELSLNSGVVWKATESDTVRLLVSRGVQLPSLATLGQFVITSPYFNFTGIPTLKPTIVWNYEANWDRTLPALDGKFRAAVFHQHSDNLVALSGTYYPGSGPPPYVGNSNAGGSTASGIELSLSGRFAEEWRWGLNYRLEAISDDFTAATQDGTAYVDFEHVTPKHVVKANLGWARGPFEIDTYLYYQSATRGLASLPFGTGSFLTPVPAYVAADARVGYRLNDRMILSLSGQNLLSSPQQQTSAAPVERRVFLTLTVDF